MTLNPNESLPGVLRGAIKQVNGLHGTRCNLAHPGSPAATVLMLRCHGYEVNYWVLADSVLMLDTSRGYWRCRTTGKP
jgi:hypothetical protein